MCCTQFVPRTVGLPSLAETRARRRRWRPTGELCRFVVEPFVDCRERLLARAAQAMVRCRYRRQHAPQQQGRRRSKGDAATRRRSSKSRAARIPETRHNPVGVAATPTFCRRNSRATGLLPQRRRRALPQPHAHDDTRQPRPLPDPWPDGTLCREEASQ